MIDTFIPTKQDEAREKVRRVWEDGVEVDSQIDRM